MGGGGSEMRALASNCSVVSAPPTALSTSQPATLSLTPMNDPFRFRPAEAISIGWRNVLPQYIPARQIQSLPRVSKLHAFVHFARGNAGPGGRAPDRLSAGRPS